MAKRRQTKGRRRPWSCGHRGYGAECHRCLQADQLEAQADELEKAMKNKTIPGFVKVTNNLESGLLIKSGGQRVFVKTNSKSQEAALNQVVQTMREHAQRLRTRTVGLKG